MPGGDKTGPMGMGAMSGRGAGYCSGSNRSGYANTEPAGGFGRGAGRSGEFRRTAGGRGWRHRFIATGRRGWMRFGSSPLPDDKEALAQRSKALQSELDAIQKQLESMD